MILALARLEASSWRRFGKGLDILTGTFPSTLPEHLQTSVVRGESPDHFSSCRDTQGAGGPHDDGDEFLSGRPRETCEFLQRWLRKALSPPPPRSHACKRGGGGDTGVPCRGKGDHANKTAAPAPPLSHFSPAQLSTSLLAVAKLQHRIAVRDSTAFVQVFANATVGLNLLAKFNSQNLANTAHAMGKLGVQREDLGMVESGMDFWTAWQRAAEAKLSGFGEQGLANSLFGMALVGANGTALVGANGMKNGGANGISGVVGPARENGIRGGSCTPVDHTVLGAAPPEEEPPLSSSRASEEEETEQFPSLEFLRRWTEQAKIVEGDFHLRNGSPKFTEQGVANSIYALALLGVLRPTPTPNGDPQGEDPHGDSGTSCTNSESTLAGVTMELAEMEKTLSWEKDVLSWWLPAARRELGNFTIQGLGNVIYALALVYDN